MYGLFDVLAPAHRFPALALLLAPAHRFPALALLLAPAHLFLPWSCCLHLPIAFLPWSCCFVCGAGVLYWSQDISNTDMRRQIYILGNPIVSWFCFACVIVFVVAGMVSLRYRSLFSGKRGLLASGRLVARCYRCPSPSPAICTLDGWGWRGVRGQGSRVQRLCHHWLWYDLVVVCGLCL
jgi:hypothetical protein